MIQVGTLSLFILLCIAGLLSPAAAIALAIAMYVFEQALQGSVGIFASRPALANIIVALVVGLAVCRDALRKGDLFRGYFSPVLTGTVLLYAWYLVSLAWSPSVDAGLKLIQANIPYFILYVVALPLLLREREGLNPAFRWTMLVGIFTLGSILFNPSFTFKDGRLSLVLSALARTNPLVLGEYAGIVMIFAALITRGPGGPLFQGVRVLAFLLGSIIALQSGSRGQLVFAVTVAVAFIPVARRVKSVAAFFGTFALVATVLAATLFIASKVLFLDVLARWDARNIAQGGSHRLSNILELSEAWARQPIAWIFGLGGNAYSAVTATGGIEEYPHNIFAEITAELGILALLVFIAMIVSTVRALIWLHRRSADDLELRTAVASLAALFCYQFFLTNKQGNLWSNVFLFATMIIVARLHTRVIQDDQVAAWEADQDRAGAAELVSNLDDPASVNDGRPIPAT
jgi:hypothetical protein